MIKKKKETKASETHEESLFSKEKNYHRHKKVKVSISPSGY